MLAEVVVVAVAIALNWKCFRRRRRPTDHILQGPRRRCPRHSPPHHCHAPLHSPVQSSFLHRSLLLLLLPPFRHASSDVQIHRIHHRTPPHAPCIQLFHVHYNHHRNLSQKIKKKFRFKHAC